MPKNLKSVTGERPRCQYCDKEPVPDFDGSGLELGVRPVGLLEELGIKSLRLLHELSIKSLCLLDELSDRTDPVHALGYRAAWPGLLGNLMNADLPGSGEGTCAFATRPSPAAAAGVW